MPLAAQYSFHSASVKPFPRRPPLLLAQPMHAHMPPPHQRDLQVSCMACISVSSAAKRSGVIRVISVMLFSNGIAGDVTVHVPTANGKKHRSLPVEGHCKVGQAHEGSQAHGAWNDRDAHRYCPAASTRTGIIVSASQRIPERCDPPCICSHSQQRTCMEDGSFWLNFR